jgi:hypothetical protein
MALRGLAHIGNLHHVSGTEADVDVNYVGFGADPVEAGFNIRVAQSSTPGQIEAQVAAAVKDRLAAEHGYVIEVGDTVRVFGMGVIEA